MCLRVFTIILVLCTVSAVREVVIGGEHFSTDLETLEINNCVKTTDDLESFKSNINSFRNLKSLHLGANQFGEKVAITDLPELRSISVAASKFRGRLIVSALPNLEELHVERSQFSLELILCDLPALKVLKVERSEFQAGIDTHTLVNLEKFVMHHSEFGRSSDLSALPALKELEIRQSKFADRIDISDLPMLETLCLKNSQFRAGFGLSNNPALKRLEISEIEFFPILDLSAYSNPQELNIGELDITSFMIEQKLDLSALPALKELEIWGSKFADGIDISGLPRLETLCLENSQCKGGLSLSNNPALKRLEISRIELIDGLDLSALTGLEMVFFSNCKFRKKLFFTNFVGLRKLNIYKSEFRDGIVISSLPALEDLCISGTGFEDSLNFTGLSRLSHIQIGSSELTSIHPSITSIARGVTHLDVTDCTSLEPRGSNGYLGYADLDNLVRGCILYPKNAKKEKDIPPPNQLLLSDLEAILDAEPLHWNRKSLRALVPCLPSPHVHSGRKMLSVWRDDVRAPILARNSDATSTHSNILGTKTKQSYIEGYICFLYDLFTLQNTIWSKHQHSLGTPESIDIRKNYLEAVLRKAADTVSIDLDTVLTAISILTDGLVFIRDDVPYCIDRQIAALQQAYCLLFGIECNDDTTVIRNTVARLKDYAFQVAFTPSRGSQNVHLLNTWKWRLRNELGFEKVYESVYGTIDKDPFNGCTGNALRAFYAVFTPVAVVRELKSHINESRRLINAAGSILSKRLQDPGYASTAFDFATEDDKDMFIPSGITESGAQDILVDIGMLIVTQ